MPFELNRFGALVAGSLLLASSPAGAVRQPVESLARWTRDQGAPAGCRHEPPGLSPIWDGPWSLGDTQEKPNGWRVTRGRGRLSLVNESNPAGDVEVLRGKFPQGMKGGGGPFHVQLPLGSVKELYQCFWLKVLPGFTNNGNAETKFAFVHNATSGTGRGSSWYLRLFASPQDHGNMGVNVEGSRGKINRNMGTRFSWRSHLGEWHLFEVYTTMSTPGLADGRLRLWVDGRLDISVDNVTWLNPGASPETGWELIDITPTYGGGHNPVPHDLFIHLSPWYVSGH